MVFFIYYLVYPHVAIVAAKLLVQFIQIPLWVRIFYVDLSKAKYRARQNVESDDQQFTLSQVKADIQQLFKDKPCQPSH